MNIYTTPLKDYGEIRMGELHQWDQGQILVLEETNLTTAPLVHFSHKRDATAFVVQSVLTDGSITANIPNKLLESSENIFAHVSQDDTVLLLVQLEVIKRAKPNDYVEDPTQSTTWGEIMEAANKVAEAVDAIKEATSSFDETKAFVQAAKEAAETAKTDAETASASALESKNSAAASAATATQKANEATQAAASIGDAVERAEAEATKAAGSANAAAGMYDLAKDEADRATAEATKSANAAAEAKASENIVVSAKNAAESAKTGSESAKAAAETANTAAQAAKTAAETAETSAEGHANAADESASQAAISAGNASASEQAAQSANTSAQGAKTAAESSKTAAEAAKVAAEKARDEAQNIAGGDYVTNGKFNEHNTSAESHNDIRIIINGLTSRLNALADSDDTTLDQMSEIVAYIKSNKSLIDNITTTKVNVADIIDNLTTNVANKPLSAAQGVVIKGLIEGLAPKDSPTFIGSPTAPTMDSYINDNRIATTAFVHSMFNTAERSAHKVSIIDDTTMNNTYYPTIMAVANYVSQNGGKINEIKVNGQVQSIVNKSVDIKIPDLTEYATKQYVDSLMLVDTETVV